MTLTAARIQQLTGGVDDVTLAELLALDASETDLIEALHWLAGPYDGGPAQHPHGKKAMAAYALLAPVIEDEDRDTEVTA